MKNIVCYALIVMPVGYSGNFISKTKCPTTK